MGLGHLWVLFVWVLEIYSKIHNIINYSQVTMSFSSTIFSFLVSVYVRPVAVLGLTLVKIWFEGTKT